MYLELDCPYHLEETDGTSQMCRLLFIRHESHLVRDVFEPRLIGLTMSYHLCKPGSVSLMKRNWGVKNRLLANHWLLDQFLSKYQALIAPLHALFGHQSTHSNYRASHHPSLVVKI